MSDEGALCSLTEVERELEFAPDILGCLDLRAGSAGRRGEDARMARSDPWGRVSQGGVTDVGHGESQMSVKTASESGGNRSRVSTHFVGQDEKCLVRGLATNLGERLVLEIRLGDVGDSGRQHGRVARIITKLCHYVN